MYRTPEYKRAVYVYKSEVTGAEVTLRPGEDGVTEANIAELHDADDAEYNGVRAETRTDRKTVKGVTSLDALPYEIRDRKDPFEAVDLLDAVSRLPEKQANAIKAVYFDGMTARDYARLTGTSEANISKRIRAGIKNLQKFYEGG